MCDGGLWHEVKTPCRERSLDISPVFWRNLTQIVLFQNVSNSHKHQRVFRWNFVVFFYCYCRAVDFFLTFWLVLYANKFTRARLYLSDCLCVYCSRGEHNKNYVPRRPRRLIKFCVRDLGTVHFSAENNSVCDILLYNMPET